MAKDRKWAWKQFGELKTCYDLETYLDGREYDHGGYFHYTKLEIADSILRNREFWLSNVSGFNDTVDSRQFGKGEQPYFSLCFSTGLSENLPLWYLYSGIDGHGARLQVSKTWVRSLIQHGTFYLCRTEKDKVLERIMPLKHNGSTKSMELTFRDVIYAQPRGNSYALKYNTMTNYKIPTHEFEKYMAKHIGFCKSLIWYYEKETRLLVHLIGEADAEWRRQIQGISTENLRVTLSFDDLLFRRIKLTLVPNIAPDEIDSYIGDQDGIQQLLRATAPVYASQYAGTIKLRLCDNCKLKQKLSPSSQTN